MSVSPLTVITLFTITEDPIKAAFIDPESDVITSFGAITWRRRGQEDPESSTYLWSVRTDELDMMPLFFSEYLIAMHPTIPSEQIHHMISSIMERINTRMSTGEGWQYTHSPSFYEKINVFDNVEGRYEPLYQFEHSLLTASSSPES